MSLVARKAFLEKAKALKDFTAARTELDAYTSGLDAEDIRAIATELSSDPVIVARMRKDNFTFDDLKALCRLGDTLNIDLGDFTRAW